MGRGAAPILARLRNRRQSRTRNGPVRSRPARARANVWGRPGVRDRAVRGERDRSGVHIKAHLLNKNRGVRGLLVYVLW